VAISSISVRLRILDRGGVSSDLDIRAVEVAVGAVETEAWSTWPRRAERGSPDSRVPGG
jgi:hypothetical protein